MSFFSFSISCASNAELSVCRMSASPRSLTPCPARASPPKIIHFARLSPTWAWSKCPTRAYPRLRRSFSRSASCRRRSKLSIAPASSQALRRARDWVISVWRIAVTVVRCFQEPDVVHVSGQVDPRADIEVIHTELALVDLATVDKALARSAKAAKSGHSKEAAQMLALLQKMLAHLNAAQPARTLGLTAEERALLAPLCLLTVKPALYVANVDEDGLSEHPLLNAAQRIADAERAPLVPVCAALEAELADLSQDDQAAFLAEMGLSEPGLNRVIRAGFECLGLHTYFTAGVKEVRAWMIPRGATAPQAAGAIHSDFERGFIRAQTVAYDDFLAHQGEQGAKEAGKMRSEGKEYVVQDGDVIHFLFNV